VGARLPSLCFSRPQIGFLQEMLRWWDHWLKGVDTGIMEEPMLRAWMTRVSSPRLHEALPGRWVAEPTWPPVERTPQRLYLADNGLSAWNTPLLPGGCAHL